MKFLTKRRIEAAIFIIIFGLFFGLLGTKMGTANMLNTIMNTAHDLLLNTVFYLMGMCVVTGALGKIFTEFGVVNLLQKALKPVMRPVFHMPGVASLGAILTFLSANPAIIALSLCALLQEVRACLVGELRYGIRHGTPGHRLHDGTGLLCRTLHRICRRDVRLCHRHPTDAVLHLQGFPQLSL